MATIFKHDEIDFKEDTNKIDLFRLCTASPRFSSVAKSKNLKFDLRLLNPGQFSFPYHFHRHAEELMMVVSGAMTVRTPDGLQQVSQGDILFFEMGETGAHQLYNHTEIPCTYLDIRTIFGADVCEYPDSGKINILPEQETFKKSSQTRYFAGEENILEKWEEIKKGKKAE
jgi:uncharacterized cupin superfamily protein